MSIRPNIITTLIITVTAMTCLTAFLKIASADMYQYIDKSGTLCMTNDLANVPPAHRKAARIIREDPKPKPVGPTTSTDMHSQEQTPDPLPASAPIAANAARLPAFPWLKIVSTILGAVALLLGMHRLCRALSSPQLAKVIYVTFFLGIFVLGYKLYTDHLVNGYFAIKGKFLTLFAKAQQREGLSAPRPKNGELEP